MIEIIKRVPPPEVSKFFETCDKCKSELSFLSTDAERVDTDSLAAFVSHYYKIKCPVCEATVVAAHGCPIHETGELPYIVETETTTIRKFNPHYNQDAKCQCGYVYSRHFDGYEEDSDVGCKYCDCYTFVCEGV
jgi:hypothetical protein